MAEKILKAAWKLCKAMDKTVDENLPSEIASVVKDHSKGAAAAALAAGWIPGAGGTAAVAISAGFIWTMYGRINDKIDLPFSENVLKSVASGVATNLVAYVLGGLAISTAFSLIPGLGSIGASAVIGATCYALTLASGFVYLNVLANLFSEGHDPTTMDAESLKRAAEDVVKDEDIKSVIDEAKASFKDAEKRGEID